MPTLKEMNGHMRGCTAEAHTPTYACFFPCGGLFQSLLGARVDQGLAGRSPPALHAHAWFRRRIPHRKDSPRSRCPAGGSFVCVPEGEKRAAEASLASVAAAQR